MKLAITEYNTMYYNNTIRKGSFSDLVNGWLGGCIPFPIRLQSIWDIDMVACINEARETVTLFIVNRSMEEVNVNVALLECNAQGTGTIHEITGDSYDSINSVFEPNAITCTSKSINNNDGQISCQLRPTSIYALEFKTNPI
ncbi:hypothetical protein [Paenibacillus qinlingensis]|uniref:Alpha-L-arabinofuranosidase n=1 Tax=Paenibacillus qinlingensis TaxID=1837343 RepID=A0ABU1NTY4_9BACL|nr:hypothetical protein [Paenibacillus qinlingensis]MDR6550946.1 alpha-L-arabinofuranosidase [Paenibacillus qinlingensis]